MQAPELVAFESEIAENLLNVAHGGFLPQSVAALGILLRVSGYVKITTCVEKTSARPSEAPFALRCANRRFTGSTARCYHVGMEGRILIIDDDAGVRRVLDRILCGAGYEVEQASDAFQALDLLDSRQPDAALLDIKMPGMDGFGLLDNLRRRGLEIPVVILTGHGDQFTAQALP